MVMVMVMVMVVLLLLLLLAARLITDDRCSRMQANRQAVEAVYEIKPMASEHKTPGENKMNHFIS